MEVIEESNMIATIIAIVGLLLLTILVVTVAIVLQGVCIKIYQYRE